MSLALAFTAHGQPFNAARDLGGNSTWVPFPGTAGRGGTVPGSFPGISPTVTYTYSARSICFSSLCTS